VVWKAPDGSIYHTVDFAGSYTFEVGREPHGWLSAKLLGAEDVYYRLETLEGSGGISDNGRLNGGAFITDMTYKHEWNRDVTGCVLAGFIENNQANLLRFGGFSLKEPYSKKIDLQSVFTLEMTSNGAYTGRRVVLGSDGHLPIEHNLGEKVIAQLSKYTQKFHGQYLPIMTSLFHSLSDEDLKRILNDDLISRIKSEGLGDSTTLRFEMV